MRINGQWQPDSRGVTDLRRLSMVCRPSLHQIEGIGGSIEVLTVETKLRLEVDTGATIDINGPFDGLEEGRDGELSILGRDVLGHFAAIFDRPVNIIALLHGRHRYSIHEV